MCQCALRYLLDHGFDLNAPEVKQTAGTVLGLFAATDRRIVLTEREVIVLYALMSRYPEYATFTDAVTQVLEGHACILRHAAGFRGLKFMDHFEDLVDERSLLQQFTIVREDGQFSMNLVRFSGNDGHKTTQEVPKSKALDILNERYYAKWYWEMASLVRANHYWRWAMLTLS